LDHNQYPNPLAEARSILYQHQWDEEWNKGKSNEERSRLKNKYKDTNSKSDKTKSLKSHLHKQKMCTIIVERKGIYPQYANTKISQ